MSWETVAPPAERGLADAESCGDLSRCQNTSGSIYFYGIVHTKTNYIKIHLSVTIKIYFCTNSYICRIGQNERIKPIPTMCHIQNYFQFWFWMGVKHFCFSQFSCEKRKCFAPIWSRPSYFGWCDYRTINTCSNSQVFFLRRVSQCYNTLLTNAQPTYLSTLLKTRQPWHCPPLVQNQPNTQWEFGRHWQKNYWWIAGVVRIGSTQRPKKGMSNSYKNSPLVHKHAGCRPTK